MDKKISSIAERLKEALTIRHMTAAELSRKTGVKESDISHYKKGDYEPASKNLEKISEAFNVSIPWLMGFDVPMEEAHFNNEIMFPVSEDNGSNSIYYDIPNYKFLSDVDKKAVKEFVNFLYNKNHES